MWLIMLAILQASWGNPDSRVVSGEPVQDGEWLDASGVLLNDNLLCSGVVIAPDLVLTAGHCVSISSHTVSGTHAFEEKIGEQRTVADKWLYPDHLKTLDILVLRLNEPVTVPPRSLVRTCIRDQYLVDGAAVSIVGFGATDENGLEFPSRLYQAETTIIDAQCTTPNRDCNEEVLPFGELIAGGDGVDSCVRDSGGPLYLHTPHGAYLAGITSRGIRPADTNCGDGGIYVRADAVAEWIEEVTGESLPTPDCAALGLNQRPVPKAEPITVAVGTGAFYRSSFEDCAACWMGQTAIHPHDPDENDGHKYTLHEAPKYGIVHIQPDGQVQYRTPHGLGGTDLFTVAVTDDGSPPLTTTLEISVNLIEPGTPLRSTCAHLFPRKLWFPICVWTVWVLCAHRRRQVLC